MSWLGKRVKFDFDCLKATGKVFKEEEPGLWLVVLDAGYSGWRHGIYQCWYVREPYLEPLEPPPPPPLSTSSFDRYAVGPEGETAGYLAGATGLRFL